MVTDYDAWVVPVPTVLCCLITLLSVLPYYEPNCIACYHREHHAVTGVAQNRVEKTDIEFSAELADDSIICTMNSVQKNTPTHPSPTSPSTLERLAPVLTMKS
jgi:hypothetical protein